MQVLELAAALASLGLLDGELGTALEGSRLLEEEVARTPSSSSSPCDTINNAVKA